MDAYKAKAAAGDAEAQFNLGFFYQCGLSVAQDDALAVKWYTKAAAAACHSRRNRARALPGKGGGGHFKLPRGEVTRPLGGRQWPLS